MTWSNHLTFKSKKLNYIYNFISLAHFCKILTPIAIKKAYEVFIFYTKLYYIKSKIQWGFFSQIPLFSSWFFESIFNQFISFNS